MAVRRCMISGKEVWKYEHGQPLKLFYLGPTEKTHGQRILRSRQAF